ncbi:MAG: PAAR domain-containing protein [Byssovorax sp.]
MLAPAARIDDSVGHTYKKAAVAAGAAAGVVIGILLVFIPGGAEADVEVISLFGEAAEEASMIGEIIEAAEKIGYINDLLQTGKWLGGVVADIASDKSAGKIKGSAERTFTESKRNARITDALECKDPAGTTAVLLSIVVPGGGAGLAPAAEALGMGQHTGAKIAKGSETVFIEGLNAARMTETTSCAGWITTGAKKTFIGGESVTLEGTEDANEEGAFLADVLWGAGKLGSLASFIGSLGNPMSIALESTKQMFEIAAANTEDPELKRKLEQTAAIVDVVKSLSSGKIGKVVKELPVALGKVTKATTDKEEEPKKKEKIVSYPGR